VQNESLELSALPSISLPFPNSHLPCWRQLGSEQQGQSSCSSPAGAWELPDLRTLWHGTVFLLSPGLTHPPHHHTQINLVARNGSEHRVGSRTMVLGQPGDCYTFRYQPMKCAGTKPSSLSCGQQGVILRHSPHPSDPVLCYITGASWDRTGQDLMLHRGWGQLLFSLDACHLSSTCQT
jgi:hypothetical protein